MHDPGDFSSAGAQGDLEASVVARVQARDFSRETLADMLYLCGLSIEDILAIEKILSHGALPPSFEWHDPKSGETINSASPPALKRKNWLAWRRAIYFEARYRLANKGKVPTVSEVARAAFGLDIDGRKQVRNWRTGFEFKEYYEDATELQMRNLRDQHGLPPPNKSNSIE